MKLPEVLQRIATALDRAGIAYMLTGSFASAYYGLPRSTQDVDLVIQASPTQLREFVQSLPDDEYYADLDAAFEAHSRQSLFNVIDLASGWKIDMIIRKSRPFSREEFNRRELMNIDGHTLFVATAEDVIIAKLEWSKLSGSRRQIEDVAAILRIRSGSLSNSYLDKWISELRIENEWREARAAAGDNP